MSSINRRRFLSSGAVAVTALSISPSLWAQPTGANSDIRLAVVGFNGQGKSHIEGFRKIPGVRVVGLCDVDSAVLNREAVKFKDRNEAIATYSDVRKLLENKDIDAISIATPNHSHALIAIWAIQAGKDVYVEKPVSHNVSEGRRIVEAARKHKRMVQTGTQSRSNPGVREAIQFLHDGGLGKIKWVRGLCYKRRASIGKITAPQLPPSTVDYDLWCGPAPKEPLTRTRLHYDWHWVWPTGSGDLGNQGIHQMDIARWALGVNELSPQVFSFGGRFSYLDDGTTPNTQIIYHSYPTAPLIFEVRGLPAKSNGDAMDNLRGASIGVVIQCENGSMVIPSYQSATAFDTAGKVFKQFRGDASHHANFIQAVRSRKQSDLNADILEGHLSSALCHTGNISYRLGKLSKPEEVRDAIKNQPEAGESFARFAEHLKANEVDITKSPAQLGVVLKMDPKKERFLGNSAANELLTREYRKGFVVPNKV